jgi:predicted small lipoprotein YifL
MLRVGRLLVVLGLVSCLSGCGADGPKFELTPVKGVVKIDGQPAPNVMVQVMPDIAKNAQGPTSQAVSNASGEFTLQTIEGKPGAAVGESVAIFIDTVEDRPAQGEVGKPPRFPGSYATAKGGIPVKIESGKDLVFELKSR